MSRNGTGSEPAQRRYERDRAGHVPKGRKSAQNSPDAGKPAAGAGSEALGHRAARTATRDIVVVGPCGSGKSTLVARLTALGYQARAVAQEHSVVRELWRHSGEPSALILLHAEPATITRRRQADFPTWLHAQQLQRLATAREHADLVVATDHHSPDTVAAHVVAFLDTAGIRPLERPADGR